MQRNLNMFTTILVRSQPSQNFRGESEQARNVLQKIVDGDDEYAVYSAPSIRNALRERLAQDGFPVNRTRLHDEDQLMVHITSLPDIDRFIDDYIFGYMVAVGKTDRENHLKKVEKEIENGQRSADVDFTFKRDTIIRVNLAKSLMPYRDCVLLMQSPKASEKSAYRNAKDSALIGGEIIVSSFQYPVQICFRDFVRKPDWARALLRALPTLNNVGGNQARSYFDFAAESAIVRLSTSPVFGYDSYCFLPNGQTPLVIDDILAGDLPGEEFFIGGEIVKRCSDDTRYKGFALSAEQVKALTNKGVTLVRTCTELFDKVADLGLASVKQTEAATSPNGAKRGAKVSK